MSKLTDLLKENVEKDTFAQVCPCGGGGVDYDSDELDRTCKTCKGTGIYDWDYNYFLEHTEQQIKALFNEIVDKHSYHDMNTGDLEGDIEAIKADFNSL
jgi:hypothetical protein